MRKKKSVVTEYFQQHFTVSMQFVQSNPVIRTTKHKKCREKTTSTYSTLIEIFFLITNNFFEGKNV